MINKIFKIFKKFITCLNPATKNKRFELLVYGYSLCVSKLKFSLAHVSTIFNIYFSKIFLIFCNIYIFRILLIFCHFLSVFTCYYIFKIYFDKLVEIRKIIGKYINYCHINQIYYDNDIRTSYIKILKQL